VDLPDISISPNGSESPGVGVNWFAKPRLGAAGLVSDLKRSLFCALSTHFNCDFVIGASDEGS
jgi:hypothetical protein